MRTRFLIFAAFIAVGSLSFYNSRGISELGDDATVTELPQEVRSVLGAQTAKPEIAIRVPVLMYHYVEYVQDKNDTTRQSLNIPPHTLTLQIQTLKQAGYTFINVSELADALSGKTKLPQKAIVLTFDDGYRDFYTDVFPILKQENVKGTDYVIADFLNRPNFMFSYQVQEVAKSPLVEIAAHTMNHVWLKGINKETANYQISQSKKDLEKLIGKPVVSFAYPYGAFDQQAAILVKEAGFTNATSTVPGIEHSTNTQYFLYRLRPGYRTGEDLLKYLEQTTFKPW
ncbi:MAG TPA: polysaccharide deacetylase family protein [Patescibacteria group bacterium]|nr:polysaccharide deacetylase family protein [Patescibacteria group bacterium]